MSVFSIFSPLGRGAAGLAIRVSSDRTVQSDASGRS
jgi:hypothetical protein